jgi:hypothetical protein
MGANIGLYTAPSGTAGDPITFTQQMAITPTGIGIGSTNAISYLHIKKNGNALTTLGTSRWITLDNTGAALGDRMEIGMSYLNGNTYSATVIGAKIVENSGYTNNDFYVANGRDESADNPPIVRFLIRPNGFTGIKVLSPLQALHVGGQVQIDTVTTGSNTDSVIVISNGLLKKVLQSSIGGGSTIYSGDGSLAGNRIITGATNNLTFTGIGNYVIAATYLAQEKTGGTTPYTSTIGLTAGNYWQFGYTPAGIGSYTRGVGIIIDTLNNAGFGDLPQTTMPMYATGNSTYIAGGLQSKQGNFYSVSNITSSTTIGVTVNFITVDATGGAVTITLPAASACFGSAMGIEYVFKRLDNSGNTITIQRNATPGTDTLDGAASFTLGAQYDSKKVRAISTSAFSIF